MIKESILPMLGDIDYNKYCVHEGGHEWIWKDKDDNSEE